MCKSRLSCFFLDSRGIICDLKRFCLVYKITLYTVHLNGMFAYLTTVRVVQKFSAGFDEFLWMGMILLEVG